MADEKENQQEAGAAPAAEGGESTPAPKKPFPLKLILIVVGALVLVGGGVGAYLMFFSKKGNAAAHEESASDAHGDAKAMTPDLITYYEFPELLINLKAEQGAGSRFLKANFVLELEKKEDEEKIKAQTPRITDMFQVYLRELRINDIEGAGGMDRVRDELFARLNQLLTPVRVHNILFKQFLIQ